MRPTISVIIPTYQGAALLGRCLDSLLSQTFSDIEVVVVDDGSTDNTAEMMGSYAQKDRRIVSLRQENGGVSRARNTGLEKASGEWIAFVDSDDWADAQYLSSLLPQNADTDFVIGGYTEHRSGRDTTHQPAAMSSHKLSEAATMMGTLEAGYYLNTPWAKLYRKDIIDRHQLRFSPAFSYGEDKLFVYNYLCHCSTVEIADSIFYHYDNQPSGLSRKTYPPMQIWQWNEEMLGIMAKAGKTHGWPQPMVNVMIQRSFTYFTLYMADSIYRQPLSGKERRHLLKKVYTRRRGEKAFDTKWCSGKAQRLGAALYKINSPVLSHIVYTLVCLRGGKGMMR